jgi:hypothetical protein
MAQLPSDSLPPMASDGDLIGAVIIVALIAVALGGGIAFGIYKLVA